MVSNLKRPPGWMILSIHAIVLALLSGSIVRFDLPDSLLLILVVPCVVLAFFYGRQVYLSMAALSLVAAVWVTSLVSSDLTTSLITIAVAAVSALAMAEVVRAVALARGRVHEILNKQSEENRLLAEMGMFLLDCDQAGLVFDRLGTFLSRVAPDAIIIVNQATPDGQSLVTRQVLGIEGALWAQVEKLAGVKIIGKVSPIVPELRGYFSEARLQKVPDGFSALAASEVPVAVCKAAEKLLGFRDVFTIGIADRNTIWGNVQVITRQPAEPGAPISLPVHLIEAVVYQCFSTLSRIHAAQELAASEANFRAFFETMTDMIVVGAPDGRILFTNSAVSRTLGYDVAELTGMHILDLHVSDQRAEAQEILAAMFRGERDVCPLPLVRQDGTSVPVETRAWMGQWNGADCIFGISKDLTAEQEAQQRFERLFHNNPALMALSTLPDRRLFEVNDAFLAATGYAREEVIGHTSAELGLFAQPEQGAATARQLIEEGIIADVEAQIRCRDGTIRDGVFWGEVIRSQGRDYLLTVMLDVTARKQAESALRESESLLDLFFRQSLDGFFFMMLDEPVRWDDTVDKERVLDYVFAHQGMARVNGAMLAQYGATAEQFLGLTPNDLFAHDLAQRRAVWRELFDAGQRHIDADERKFDGTSMSIEGDYVCLYDAQGRITGHFGVQRDVTEQRRIFQTLQEQERFLSALNDITRAALESSGLQDVLQTLADRMGELFQADGCYLTLWDEETQMTIPGAAYGVWREHYHQSPPRPGEPTVTAAVLRSGRPLAIEDVHDTPHLSRRIADLFPDRSLLGLPLVVDDRMLGAALIAYNKKHRFTPGEVARGEQVADQIALAVDRIQAWETERRQRAALQDALDHVRTLRGLLPICASCKKIRDDQGYWHQVEVYVGAHTDAEFSHGICPDCLRKLYPEYSSGEHG